jgi:hypothetical protein
VAAGESQWVGLAPDCEAERGCAFDWFEFGTWVRATATIIGYMDDQEPFEISAMDVAASVGTILLVGLAALALYSVGIVLAYVGVVSQPGGTTTGVALAYLLLAVGAPVAIARNMRSSGSTWRRTSAVCALVVLAVSILFFPFAALPMVFAG